MALKVVECQQQTQLNHFLFSGILRAQVVNPQLEGLTFLFEMHVSLCKPLLFLGLSLFVFFGACLEQPSNTLETFRLEKIENFNYVKNGDFFRLFFCLNNYEIWIGY